MTIRTIHLQNFRNYAKKEFIFASPTVVIGPNASGKTNLLEAIFLLSVGKSFRAEKDREAIAFGKEIARVRGTIKFSNNETSELEIVLTKGEVMGAKAPIRKCSINGVRKRMIDFTGKLKIVLFWPQDLELVTNSPSVRRRYLDFVLSQIDREYKRTLISYEKGLYQRNKVLEAIRDRGAHRHQLIFWDQLLIKNGEYITRKREEYITYLNNFQFSIFNFQLKYDKSVISRARLNQYNRKEILARATLVGPHRDDFKFQIVNSKSGERDLSHFGSRGEQRLVILWLKLGELAFIYQVTGEKAVLLLDDILSELDYKHRKTIFDIIDNQQTVLTTTNLDFVKNILEDRKIQIINLP